MPQSKRTKTMGERIANVHANQSQQQRREPIWRGPEESGITFSLLSRFLVCRERFRLLVVEGLKPVEQFNARLEFGNMWHICEEEHAKGYAPGAGWQQVLFDYVRDLGQRFPLAQEEIVHWYGVCRELFPYYAKYWSEHPDVKDRKPLLQEEPFDVPYQLPSGRTVRLRGRWDSVDLIGKGADAGVWIQENKTKSSIDASKIQRQLKYDLQTMIYLIALREYREQSLPGVDVDILCALRGVRYNVIRRPAHKSTESMLKKLEDDKRAGRIGEWFARWQVPVSPAEIERFRRQTLDPILEQLCDWWGWIQMMGEKLFDGRECLAGSGKRILANHWRHPFGVYNVLDEGGSSELDHYLETGSEVGLQRITNLFPELT